MVNVHFRGRIFGRYGLTIYWPRRVCDAHQAVRRTSYSSRASSSHVGIFRCHFKFRPWRNDADCRSITAGAQVLLPLLARSSLHISPWVSTLKLSSAPVRGFMQHASPGVSTIQIWTIFGPTLTPGPYRCYVDSRLPCHLKATLSRDRRDANLWSNCDTRQG